MRKSPPKPVLRTTNSSSLHTPPAPTTHTEPHLAKTPIPTMRRLPPHKIAKFF